MTTATEDPAVEHEEPGPAPEHAPDEPLSYLLLTPSEAEEARVTRIRELEREHFRLGLHVEEGERTPALIRERADLIRLARHHAVVLGLIDPPKDDPEQPDDPGLPALPDGASQPVAPADPPEGAEH